MDGKQLKNSILQWAIQGKLVPQNPKDEPAQKLLERIAASRNGDVSPWSEAIGSSKNSKKSLFTSLRGPCKGTKQSKNPPSRIYCENGVWYEQVGTATPKDISDEIPFEIPETWAWCRLKDVVKQISAGGDKPEKCVKTPTEECNIPIYSNGETNEGLYGYTNVARIFEPSLTVSGRGTIGYTCVRRTPYVPIVRLITIIPTEIVTLEYLQKALSVLIVQAAGIGTSIPQLTVPMLAPQLFPLPPLAEQKRIVAKLEQVLSLAEEYGAAQEQLDKLNKELPEALKKSILQEAIQGKLVPQNPKDEPAQKLLERIALARHSERSEESSKRSKKTSKDQSSRIYHENGVWYEQIGTADPKDITDEIPFEIPDTWAWCRLGDIFDHKNGKQLNTANKNGLPRKYITTSNLYWDHFKLENLKTMYFTNDELDRCTAIKGDLLVCEGGDIGRAAIWNEDFDICIQNHIHKLRAYIDVCTKFFWNVLFFYKKTGLIGGKGIGIQGLSSKALHNILIPLPPLAEQKRIVTKLEQLFKVL